MTQKLRPAADLADGGWTPTPLFAQIDALVANDTTWVTSSSTPGDTFTVQLSPAAWPAAGAETLTVRLRKTDSGSLPVSLKLLQGAYLIAAQTVQPTLTFTDYPLTLTPDQSNSISDYSALSVQVSAGTQLDNSGGACGPCPALPRQWQLRVRGTSSGPDGPCAGNNGDFLLSYIGNCTWYSAWFDIFNPGGSGGLWQLYYIPVPVPHWSLQNGTGVAIYDPPDPFNCLGTNVCTLSAGGGCTWPATVTLTPL